MNPPTESARNRFGINRDPAKAPLGSGPAVTGRDYGPKLRVAEELHLAQILVSCSAWGRRQRGQAHPVGCPFSALHGHPAAGGMIVRLIE